MRLGAGGMRLLQRGALARGDAVVVRQVRPGRRKEPVAPMAPPAENDLAPLGYSSTLTLVFRASLWAPPGPITTQVK